VRHQTLHSRQSTFPRQCVHLSYVNEIELVEDNPFWHFGDEKIFQGEIRCTHIFASE
jgi:hypothetical protein